MQIQLHFAGGNKAAKTTNVLLTPLPLLVLMRRYIIESVMLLMMFFISTKLAVASVRATSDDATADATGYSYSRFVGPVSGPEQRVYVHDAFSGGTRLDYVARPEYQFAYGVEDADTRVLHNRHETRDGNAVEGVYSVVDPDGSLRVVKYTADDVNGFRAEVITNGVPILHGGDQYTNSHAHLQPHAPGEYIPQQQPEYAITTQGQQTLPNEDGGNHQQYQVHETPQVQQKNTKKVKEEEAEGDEGEGDDASENDNEEAVPEGEADEEEGEAYTSYEDGSQEAHSYEANSDDDEDY